MDDTRRHTTHGGPPADNTNTTEVEDGVLRQPTRPIRPSIAGRRYSAHVFALHTTPDLNSGDVHDLESGLAIPRRACTASEQTRGGCRGSISWPVETVITIAPNRGLPSSGSDICQDLSDEPIIELNPPRQLLDNVEACGPGTYKCTVTDVAGHTRPITTLTKSLDGVEATEVVTYQLQRADQYDACIATREAIDELCESHPLPELQGPQGWLWLRYSALSTYRRIFSVVVLANAIAIACMIARCVQRPGAFTFSDATTAVATNVFVAILVRHEHCVNAMFRICLSLPHCTPIGLRRLAAKVYSYGGIHSGCGLSALFWYIFFSVLVINDYNASTAAMNSIAGVTGALNFLLALIVCTSHPTVRRLYHNAWELVHRFCGWAAVLLVWAQLWIIAATEASEQHRNVAIIAIQQPAFWFLCGITLLIIYPWLRLRRVKVEVERLSDHATRLRFPSHRRRMSACVGTKLSRSPLTENHSFATIAEPNRQKGYSVIISNAGDWTKKIIDDPPEYLWKRGAPMMGVMRLAQIFKPIVVVATGSGIGPCMSFFQTHPGWPCRIVWSTKMPEALYGASMMQSVLAADPNAIIIDTHKTYKHSRPPLVALCYAVYKESNAEAVVIISNPKVVDMVVFGLERYRVPAFGPIFDS